MSLQSDIDRRSLDTNFKNEVSKGLALVLEKMERVDNHLNLESSDNIHTRILRELEKLNISQLVKHVDLENENNTHGRICKDIKSLKGDMDTIKVKTTVFGVLCGIIGGFLGKIFIKY